VNVELDAVFAPQPERLDVHGASSAHSRARRNSSASRASGLPGSGV
jgi:hypothetical protein